MKGFKFDPEKLEKLNDPERLKDIPPSYILKNVNKSNPEIILDIGAGTGFFSKEFAKLPSVKKIYALDISEEAIEWMRENLVKKFPQIRPQKIAESEIDLPDQLAELVIMINLHHELHEPDKMLNEVYRLLKPGGVMAIVDWAKRKTEHGPPLAKRYTPGQIQEQIKSTNFQNINLHENMPNHFLITAHK